MEIVGQGDNAKTSTGHSRNLSLGGMFLEVEVAEAPPMQSTVLLRFSVPTQREPIEVTGEVRWVDKAVPGQLVGVGIRFQGLRARDVWALNRFFASEI